MSLKRLYEQMRNHKDFHGVHLRVGPSSVTLVFHYLSNPERYTVVKQQHPIYKHGYSLDVPLYAGETLLRTFESTPNLREIIMTIHKGAVALNPTDKRHAYSGYYRSKRTLQQLSLILKRHEDFSRVTYGGNSLSFDYEGMLFNMYRQDEKYVLDQLVKTSTGYKEREIYRWNAVPYKVKGIKFFINRYAKK